MELKKLLKSGESERVEFKRTFGKEVIISLSAFSNTEGGKVVVGVDNTSFPMSFMWENKQQIMNDE